MALPENAESATAVHVVTTELAEEGLELTARRRSPPEVQWRTFLGEARACDCRENHLAVWLWYMFHGDGGTPGRGRGGGCALRPTPRTLAESRNAAQSLRPSWVEVPLVAIVERHTEAIGVRGSKSQAMVVWCRWANVVIARSRGGVRSEVGLGWRVAEEQSRR